MSVDTRIDLTDLTGDIKASVAYDPGLDAVVGSEPVVRFSLNGPLDAMKPAIQTRPLAQYLTQRALEREEARVEHMQAVLLEKQRLRRENRYYAALEAKRKRADEESRRFDQESERMRRKAEEEARREAEEAARREAENPNADEGSPTGDTTQMPGKQGGESAIEQAPVPLPDSDDSADETPRESLDLRFPSRDFSSDSVARSFGADQ